MHYTLSNKGSTINDLGETTEKISETNLFVPRRSLLKFFFFLEKGVRNYFFSSLLRENAIGKCPFVCESSLVEHVWQGSKLLGFRVSGTPKNGDGNPNFLAGFPTGNPEIVR